MINSHSRFQFKVQISIMISPSRFYFSPFFYFLYKFPTRIIPAILSCLVSLYFPARFSRARITLYSTRLSTFHLTLSPRLNRTVFSTPPLSLRCIRRCNRLYASRRLLFTNCTGNKLFPTVSADPKETSPLNFAYTREQGNERFVFFKFRISVEYVRSNNYEVITE